MCLNALSRRSLLVGGLAASASACAYNAELGRDQLILVNEGQLSQLSASTWASTLQRERVSRDAAATRRVTTVGQRVVAAAGRGGAAWEYALFENDQANAFVLPGNKVGVNTGLLKVARTDGELAAVLGHEVAHVTARHAAERVSQGQLAQVGMTAANLAIGQSGTQYAGQIAGVLGAGVQYGVINPYSRRNELEADRLGLDYMARAGYRPSEAITLWQSMAARGGASTPAFLSTHPSDTQRIAAIEAHIRMRGYA